MSAISALLSAPPNNFSTTLSSGIASNDLTIPLNSVSGLGTEGIGVIYAKGTDGTPTTSTIEFVHWTNVSGNNLTLTDTGDRGISGSASGAQAHSAGDTFEVWTHSSYYPRSALMAVLTSAGILDTTKVVDLTTAQTLINKSISETQLTFTDVTTNDVSTSKHGFVPKAPNDAAKFLNGLGAFSVPSSSGMQYTDSRFKLGTLTRDISTASGSQAITGVGFQPTLIRFSGAINGTIQACWGASNGTVHYCVYSPDFVGSPSAAKFTVDTTSAITLVLSSSNYYTATIAMNADGFTITWTKTGSPTGTVTVIYECYR